MINKLKNYNVIVIGGGHAGIESAYAAANMNQKTLLITPNKLNIGLMHCNPSIGGIGKGQLVKEIDALGGLMGKAIDLAGTQFKILNYNKGEAVRSTRVQADRLFYPKVILKFLLKIKNLIIIEDIVIKLIIKNYTIIGVVTKFNNIILANTVIITVGTFLHSKIYIGQKCYENKYNNYEYNKLADFFINFLSLKYLRFKTGTPPRLQKNSINFNKLNFQLGDNNPIPFFSFENIYKKSNINQIASYITYTNEITHKIINNNLNYSPLYNGNIQGIGPRYCPSIEDKIIKFKNRNRHQIFLEIEGYNNNIVYPNGISTSLPKNIQKKIINSIKGLEKTNIINYGYSIEYDCFDPKNLYLTCESKLIKRLFLAGQINGTTGYEEAAAQGIIAGINASLINKNLSPWYPTRSEAYIGVLIDDLCNLGITEPYRMFTSRAEYRLLLRENNADIRLTPIGYKLGLISNKKWINYNKKINKLRKIKKLFNNIYICKNYINKYKISNYLNKNIIKKIKKKSISLKTLLLFSQLDIDNFIRIINYIFIKKYNFFFLKEVAIEIKYQQYIKQINHDIYNTLNLDNYHLPKIINYEKINNLSNEAKTKLNLYKPLTLGQAIRISGITYSSINTLLIYLKKIYKK